MSQIKDKRKVKVQNRSGFDKSFRSTLTANVGTLVPILVDELMPGSKVNLKINLATALPPLVSDTYMNVKLRVEAFAVPHRLTQRNFEEFFSDYPVEVIDGIEDRNIEFTELTACMPLVAYASEDAEMSDALAPLIGNGSLCDYMGLPAVYEAQNRFAVAAPFIAYHLIWQEWYRNPRVQRPAFMKDNSGTIQTPVVGGTPYFVNAPYNDYYITAVGQQPYFHHFLDTYDSLCADGVDMFELRQRNFDLDFFTAAMVEPQQGEPAVVKFGENGDPADGFTIASLRAMNSLQQFRERNNLTSPRYQQQLYARYGVAPSDGVIQRPVLIGAASYDVYSHGVESNSSTDAPSESTNPFNGALGSRAGNGFAGGSDFIISGFEAKEPMYLFVLASLVPEVSYSQNLNPMLSRYQGLGSISDMANAILQNVGPEPIYNEQIVAGQSDPKAIFAYTDRYSPWMYRNNEIHGLFKYGESLASFVAQRHFNVAPEFGSEFLEIPTNYLDDVMQFKSSVLGFGYWMDVMFEYKVAMPLQEYAIPSLQDPAYEHGHTITLRKNGQLL